MARTDKGWEYYAAVVASTISTGGWLVALGAALYLTYLVITSEPAGRLPAILIVAFAIGAGFGLIEKRLYRVK